jgi:endoglucanase
MHTIKLFILVGLVALTSQCTTVDASRDSGDLRINDQEYFEFPGLNIIVYHDYYAIGHQSGITIIQNGSRVAANGDIRLYPLERPLPENGKRIIDMDQNSISVNVSYPDSVRQGAQDPRYTYPDLDALFTVKVTG